MVMWSTSSTPPNAHPVRSQPARIAITITSARWLAASSTITLFAWHEDHHHNDESHDNEDIDQNETPCEEMHCPTPD